MTKPAKPIKPIKFIHRILVVAWLLWLGYRLVIYVAIMGVLGAPVGAMWLWQLLVMTPTLLLTPIVLRGRSAYGLIVAALIILMYWGVSGMMVFVRWYEHVPAMVWVGLMVEVLLLSVICLYLAKLLKRLPPMHLTNKTPKEHS